MCGLRGVLAVDQGLIEEVEVFVVDGVGRGDLGLEAGVGGKVLVVLPVVELEVF